MAATVSPWSKPGAWALDAEEHEAELLQQQNDAAAAASAAAAADFPTLSTAVAAAGGKSKKKKGQTLSLAEFTTYSGPKPAAGLTHDDRLALPKGPRERTAEELDRSRLGGGFRNYGDRGGSRGGEWGGQPRGSDRERGGGRDSVRDSGPSRADEADNWASAKKPSIGNGFERRDSRDSRDGRDRGGFFDSQSKADESDSWVANKSFAPPPPAAEARRFGGGRGGFASNGGGADSDFWGKRREESSNGFGSGSEGGTGRPRLNLQPRTLPVVSNGGGSQGTGTGTGTGTAAAVVAKPKGANPFGEARPREEVLAKKGQDWKKIDEQLDSMKIKEAGERAEGGGSSFGKRSFGSGNGRSGSSGGRTETSWRRPGSADADAAAAAAATDADDAQSVEKNEDDEPAAEN